VAKTVPNCQACQNFSKALDPITSKVYMGQCLKLEWPYAINLPHYELDGIEGECGYYEGGGPATLQK
jgi:hypothetical protein